MIRKPLPISKPDSYGHESVRLNPDMASSQIRKGSSRASLPRRTTRGPLDSDDPLSASLTPTSPQSSLLTSPIIPPGLSPSIGTLDQQTQDETDPAPHDRSEESSSKQSKDLSFLLDASIYHPLSNLDVPTPFRKPLPTAPVSGSSLSDVLARIEALLSQCDYLSAAHVAAACLTSGIVQPSDYVSIFKLLAIRYSCLELSGNTLLAAQEAKALEDLMSSFYYEDDTISAATIEAHHDQHPVSKHIMPFSLRIQALRLQNIGFSDPRRGVAALYDLGLECRDHIASPYTTNEERAQWIERLDELGTRVVNSLVEIGDLDCASRTLEQMKPTNPTDSYGWACRSILLYVKLGQVSKARALIDASRIGEGQRSILTSLLAIAEGRLDDASSILSQDFSTQVDRGLASLAKQNLAVVKLYSGKIGEAQQVTEELVSEGFSFQSLTVNLATLYELTSDRSKDLKLALASKIAANASQNKVFTNSDFKL